MISSQPIAIPSGSPQEDDGMLPSSPEAIGSTSPLPKRIRSRWSENQERKSFCIDDLESRLQAAEEKRAAHLQEVVEKATRLQEPRDASRKVKATIQTRSSALAKKISFELEAAEVKRKAKLEEDRIRLGVAHQQVLARLSFVEQNEVERLQLLSRKVQSRLDAAETKRAAYLSAVRERTAAANEKVMDVAQHQRALLEQASEQQRRVLDEKLSAAEQRRQSFLQRRLLHTSLPHKAALQRRAASARRIQRWWRGPARIPTTASLAGAVCAAGLSLHAPFEELAVLIQSPATLRCAQAFLQRAATALQGAGHEQAEETRETLARLCRPKAPARRSRRSPSSSSPPPSSSAPAGTPRYPARLFLVAYMVVAHPEEVLSEAADSLKDDLTAEGTRLLQALDAALTTSLRAPTASTAGRAGRRGAFAALDAAWDAFVAAFARWKEPDAAALESQLVAAAGDLLRSMLLKCGRRSSEELSEDMRALVAAVEHDHELLRQRIGGLTGAGGQARMDAHLLQVREEVREAVTAAAAGAAAGAASAAATAGSPGPAAAAAPPASAQPPSDSELTNERIVYELLHDDKWRPPSLARAPAAPDSPDDVYDDSVLEGGSLEEGSVEGSVEERVAGVVARVRATMERAFWDTLRERLLQAPPDPAMALGLLHEVAEQACAVLPASLQHKVRGLLGDGAVLRDVLEARPCEALQPLQDLHSRSQGLLARCRAKARDAAANAAHARVKAKIHCASPDAAHVAQGVVRWLHVLQWEVQHLLQDTALLHIEQLLPLVHSSAGLDCATKHFAARFGLPRPPYCDPPPATDPALSTASPSLPPARPCPPASPTPSSGSAASPGSPAALPQISVVGQVLPRTMQLLASAAGDLPLVAHCLGPAPAAPPPAAGPQALIPQSMKSGQGTAAEGPRAEAPAPAAHWEAVADVRSWQGLLRVGLVRLVRAEYAITGETTAETLGLDVQRLVEAQGLLQRALVTAACLLIHHQGRAAARRSPGGANAGDASEEDEENGLRGRVTVLLADPAIRLGDLAAEVARGTGLSGGAAEGLLRKMTARADAAFQAIERALAEALLHLALRGPAQGAAGAGAALARCGGRALMPDMRHLAGKLAKIADVSARVHGHWYAELADRVLTE